MREKGDTRDTIHLATQFKSFGIFGKDSEKAHKLIKSNKNFGE